MRTSRHPQRVFASAIHLWQYASFNQLEKLTMYIAMNRFKVKKDRTTDFEEMWRSRDSYLHEVDGFLAFHLLKGAEHDDYVLYASHTQWESEEHFVGWTKSDAFRKAHSHAGKTAEPATIGPPQFEGFISVLSK